MATPTLEQLSLFDPDFCQRWRGGTHTWRPVHEGGFDARRYWPVRIAEAPVRRFVTDHHYSRNFPAARLSFGLLEGEHLVGAMVLGVPMHPRVLTAPFPTLGADTAAEISRMALLDEVPSNAEASCWAGWPPSTAFAAWSRSLTRCHASPAVAC